MTKLLTTVAAVALSLGAATASAKAEIPANFVGFNQGNKPAIAQAGCYYRYYYYYSGGYYYYQYRYICY